MGPAKSGLAKEHAWGRVEKGLAVKRELLHLCVMQRRTGTSAPSAPPVRREEIREFKKLLRRR